MLFSAILSICLTISNEPLTSNIMHPKSNSSTCVQPYGWFTIIMIPPSFSTTHCWPSLLITFFEFSNGYCHCSVLTVFHLDFCSRILAFLPPGLLCSSMLLNRLSKIVILYDGYTAELARRAFSKWCAGFCLRITNNFWKWELGVYSLKNPPDDAHEHPCLKTIFK